MNNEQTVNRPAKEQKTTNQPPPKCHFTKTKIKEIKVKKKNKNK